MSGCMALWAVVSALTALAKDFKGLLLVRFFLGVTGMFLPPLNMSLREQSAYNITEAPYYPGRRSLTPCPFHPDMSDRK